LLKSGVPVVFIELEGDWSGRESISTIYWPGYLTRDQFRRELVIPTALCFISMLLDLIEFVLFILRNHLHPYLLLVFNILKLTIWSYSFIGQSIRGPTQTLAQLLPYIPVTIIL